MKAADPERERRLFDYLLGALPEAEREAVEEGLFDEDPFHEELRAAIDDLIHDYLTGALSDEDRRRFETHFLASPLRRQSFEFVRALQGAADRASGARPETTTLRRNRAFIGGLAAAAVTALVLLGLLWWRPEPGTVQTTSAPTPSPSTEPPARSTEPPIVHLSPDAPRRADIDVPASASSVRFEVAVARGYRSFSAVLQNSQGREIWRSDGLTTKGGRPLTFSVPAALLSATEYVLALEGELVRGQPPDGDATTRYVLRVRRQPRTFVTH
jgi:hypothetical protein